MKQGLYIKKNKLKTWLYYPSKDPTSELSGWLSHDDERTEWIQFALAPRKQTGKVESEREMRKRSAYIIAAYHLTFLFSKAYALYPETLEIQRTVIMFFSLTSFNFGTEHVLTFNILLFCAYFLNFVLNCLERFHLCSSVLHNVGSDLQRFCILGFYWISNQSVTSQQDRGS